MFANFHISGTTPDDDGTLKISVIGSAKICAKVFKLFGGILSGLGGSLYVISEVYCTTDTVE